MFNFNLILGIIISITVHEYAHAYMASKLGDNTPVLQWRVTLNPLAHLDPLGTLLIFFSGIGWWKPVQFNSQNLRNEKRDIFLISIIGPLSNLWLAIIAVFLRNHFIESIYFARNFLDTLIGLNVVLFLFNILPIPPLDGSKILFSLFPTNKYRFLENYLLKGHYLLIAMLLAEFVFNIPILWKIIAPLRDFLIAFLFANL